MHVIVLLRRRRHLLSLLDLGCGLYRQGTQHRARERVSERATGGHAGTPLQLTCVACVFRHESKTPLWHRDRGHAQRQQPRQLPPSGLVRCGGAA